MQSCKQLLITTSIALWAASGWAQQAPAPTSSSAPPTASEAKAGAVSLSADEMALSSEIQAFLIKELGSKEAMWQKVMGRPKFPNETLKIFVPKSAIRLGNLVYSKKARFTVTSQSQSLDNCVTPDANAKASTLKKHFQSQTQVTNTGSWSNVTTNETQQKHSLEVSAQVNLPMGAGDISSSYRFGTQDTTMAQDSNGKQVQQYQSLSIDTTLQALPLESVTYQTEVIMLVGDQAAYQASAKVDSRAPISFVVELEGFTPGFTYMSKSAYVFELDNSPQPGNKDADADLALGNSVIVSGDGAYLFGKEEGTGPGYQGRYTVVNGAASPGGNVTRLWTPVPSNTCATDNTLTITKDGRLQLLCGSKLLWDAGTSRAQSNPCFYLAFRGNAGELACYSQNPKKIIDDAQRQTVMNAPVWSNKSASKSPAATTAQTFSNTYKWTLKELVGRPSHEFVFSGTYTGNQVIAGPNYCSFTYDLAYQMKTHNCVRVATPGVAENATTGRTETTNSAHAFKKRYCPQTEKFLAPFLANNPLLLAE